MKVRPPRAALLLALVGCIGVPQPIANPGAAQPLARRPIASSDAAWSPAPIDLLALEGEVALVRKLPLAHAIGASALSDEAFRARVEASTRLGKRAGEARNAFLGTLGATSVERSPGDSERRMLEEGVAGIYDHHAGLLFVRGATDDEGRIVPRDLGARIILAHEIVHALQDQHFDLGRGDGLPRDEALAYAALVEGDAVLSSNAVEASDRGDLDRWFATVSARPRASAEEMAAHAGLPSPETARAPALLRRGILFPYIEGTAFVLELYRRGGFDRVDKAFARPPQSTTQVLHIEKYLAGEQPIPVEWPHPPPGWQVITVGIMGELQTNVFLSSCLPPDDAAAASIGWGGDAWMICSNSENESAMLWSTVWDDEASAARFEQAARARTECASATPLFQGTGKEIAVVRDGRHVAYVQGLPKSQRDTVARGLLSLPFERPPARPPF